MMADDLLVSAMIEKGEVGDSLKNTLRGACSDTTNFLCLCGAPLTFNETMDKIICSNPRCKTKIKHEIEQIIELKARVDGETIDIDIDALDLSNYTYGVQLITDGTISIDSNIPVESLLRISGIDLLAENSEYLLKGFSSLTDFYAVMSKRPEIFIMRRLALNDRIDIARQISVLLFDIEPFIMKAAEHVSQIVSKIGRETVGGAATDEDVTGDIIRKGIKCVGNGSSELVDTLIKALNN